MLFLLDTNAISDLMEQRTVITARLRSLPASDRVITCPIVVGEIVQGIERLAPGRRKTTLERESAAIFLITVCQPLPCDAASHYSQLKIHCRRHGLALDENDFWIAATSRAMNAVLVTRDKDFTRIPSLIVEDWSI